MSVSVTHVIGVFGLSGYAAAQRIAELMMSENPTVDTEENHGEISVIVTAAAENETEAEALCRPALDAICERLGSFVYGVDVSSLQERVVALLKEKQLKIATAESCTAGMLSGRLTEVAGVSDVFECGVAAYSNEIKHSVLGVPADLLELYGAISAEVASAMAVGARRISGAAFGIGITGVAGPGTSEGKPTGTVYIALADDKRVWVKKLEESGADREEVRAIATTHALDLARRYLEALPAIMAGSQLLERPSSEKQALPVGKPNRHGILDHLLLSRAKGKAAVFRCLGIWFLIVLLAVAIVLSSYNFIYRPLHNEQIYNDLESLYDDPPTTSDASDNTVVYPEGMSAQFYVLYDRNPDIRGWIEVEGLLRYPVMDNCGDFYASHDFSKGGSAYGVPYFAADNDFSAPDSDNRVLTVYGHQTEDGQMFSPLTRYVEPSFFVQHEYLTLNTIFENARWQVCAVFYADESNDRAEFDYTQNHFDSDEAYTAFMAEIADRSLFTMPVSPTADDRWLMLSVGPEGERNGRNERLVIAARKWPAGEPEPSFAVTENDNPRMPGADTSAESAESAAASEAY